MARQPEFREFADTGIVERALSQDLKQLRTITTEVRHKSVHDLEPVLIGLVLVMPGDSVHHRIRRKQPSRTAINSC